MTHDELRKAMGEYNPNQSHHSRMTKQGIILAKDRKARVQKELDENIARAAKSEALKKKIPKEYRGNTNSEGGIPFGRKPKYN